MIANKELLEKQKVTNDQRNNLISLYARLRKEFDIAQELLDKDELDASNANIIKEEIQSIEYQMQDNWNFNRDKFKHKYWYRVPGCTCPKLDNEDRWGTIYQVTSKDCPFHGIEEEE